MRYVHLSGGPIDYKLKQEHLGIWFTDLMKTLNSADSRMAYGSSFETSHTWEASAHTSRTYAEGNVTLYKER